MTQIIEIQKSYRDDPGTPDEIVAKLTALDWQITEEREDAYVLQHDLIPGAMRFVIRT